MQRAEEVEDRRACADVALQLEFSMTFGVVKVGAVIPVKSCVHRSSPRSFSPGTPISLMAMLMMPPSFTSGGATGPGPPNRTQAG